MLHFRERQIGSGPGPRSEEISMKATVRPPRQMTVKGMFEGSVAGANARSVGVLARFAVSWPS